MLIKTPRNTKPVSLAALLITITLLSLLAACGDTPTTASGSATSATATSTTRQPGSSPAATATGKPDELTILRDLSQRLTATSQALAKNDVVAAKAAYSQFDNSWYDGEVFVQTRSKDNYLAIETAMAPVGKGLLRTDSPVAADLVPLVATLQQKFDVAVKLAETGPGLAGVNAQTAISGADVDSATAKVDQYLKTQVEGFSRDTTAFTAAVKAKDLAKSKETYLLARRGYESIEFMAAAFKDLDSAVDARASDFPLAEQDPNWTGFHVLEKAIYVDAKLDAGTDKIADKLLADVTQLNTQIKTMTIDPSLAIAGGLDLIEEIQATKITGEEESYSHTDLNDFKANLASAKALYTAYSSFVKQRNAVLDNEIQTSFADVEKSIAPYFDAAGNLTTDYSKVDDPTRKVLAQKIETLANSFSQVAGTLGLH